MPPAHTAGGMQSLVPAEHDAPSPTRAAHVPPLVHRPAVHSVPCGQEAPGAAKPNGWHWLLRQYRPRLTSQPPDELQDWPCIDGRAMQVPASAEQ